MKYVIVAKSARQKNIIPPKKVSVLIFSLNTNCNSVMIAVYRVAISLISLKILLFRRL